jgi:CRISPR-associated protein Cas5 subtype I-B
MKAVTFKIDFFEAQFKVHYTKAFRLTYPIPLPTSVAGMFASALGISRDDIKDEFRDCIFGASCSSGVIEQGVEQATFIQYKSRDKRFYIKGVVPSHLLIDPSYYIVMAGNDAKIEEYRAQILRDGMEFQPFGGQNDYFARDWLLVEGEQLGKSKEIMNYLPADYVERIGESTSLEMLPVKYRISRFSEPEKGTPDFCFITNGHVISKKEMDVCRVGAKSIALYSLGDFELYEEK